MSKCSVLIDNKFFLPFTSLFILILGFSVDALVGGGFFPRSGALLVCFAILGVWRSDLLKRKAENAAGIINNEIKIAQEISHMSYRAADWTQDPKHIEKAVKDARSLENAYQLFWDNEARLSNLQTVSGYFVKQQIVVALLGTMVWAFGDLITNRAFHCTQFIC